MTTTNTATDVAERLPRLLDELARSTPTQSEHATFDPNVSMLVRDSRDAQRPRRLAAAAAVVMLIAGAGALAFARPDSPGTAPAAATPSGTAATPNDPEADTAQRVEPTLFPAIDEPPVGLEVTARIEVIPGSSMFTEALIARSDGTVITDSVAITVQAEPFEISPMAGKAPTTTEVFGKPATVYDYGVEVATPVVHVTWGTGPYFLATGADPVALLDAADSDTFAAVSDAGAAPALTIGELPDGYAVIAEPTVVGRATTSATLSIGADNYDISVSTRNLIVAMAQAGPLRRVEVNGADGWMFNTTGITGVALTQDVAWKVDATTYAYLKVNDGTNADEALALARRITFLERNSWTARYLAPADQTGVDVVVDTTIEVDQRELIAPAAVVCVDAGATDQTVRLCMDELGGQTIQAAKQIDNSFVMPVNPADATHQADTDAIGDALNLPVFAFDGSYLPIAAETTTAATIYLVLGRDNAPYTR
jgi:hypothetical protein